MIGEGRDAGVNKIMHSSCQYSPLTILAFITWYGGLELNTIDVGPSATALCEPAIFFYC